MPILPQNLLAVKEENPKVFNARVLYIIIYLILLGLFIAYAVINLIEFLDAQDNPALNQSVKAEDSLDFPVMAVCPYFTDKAISTNDITVNYCGSLERDLNPQCKSKGKKDSGSKGNNDVNQRLDNCKANKVDISLPSFVGSEPSYNAYGCVILNLEQEYTEAIQSTIFTDDVCNTKAPSGGKSGGKGKKGGDIEVAIATGVGYQDRYDFDITTKVNSDSNDDLQTFSMVIKPSIEDFDLHSADDANNGFPENSLVALVLRKVSFKCVDCSDDEKVYYYNNTLELLSLTFGGVNPKKEYTTRVLVYFDGIVTTELEETITTSTLDYLGNFAGMLGTLLGFAVINYLDRLLCYFIINQGGMASVWDDYN